jgi:hypothetical protein
LTCWRQNKASKGYVASRGRLSLVKALKWGICELVLNMCILGSAPLLERWRTLEMAAHNIERWRALMLQIFCWTCVLDMGEVAAPHPTLGSSLLTIGALLLHMVRPPHWDLHPNLYKSKRSLPLLASWSLRRIAYCIILIVILFHIGIKEDFGGQVGGLSKCVDACK